MTDPTDDTTFDATLARLVGEAGEDAPVAPVVSTFAAAPRAAPRRRPRARAWAAAGAAGLALAGVVALVVVAGDDDSDRILRPVATTPTTLVDPPTSTPPTSTPPTGAPSSSSAGTTPATVAPQPALITRPVVAGDGCTMVWAREVGATSPVTLFARASATPVPIQVIGDPVAGPTGAFAVVLRYLGEHRESTGPQGTVDISGTPVWISSFDDGNGEAVWDLPDGSQGYVRSRGVGRETLIALVAALSPRGTSSSLPGFDVATTELPPGFELLHEQLSTELAGGAAHSACVTAATGYRYRISALAGDPVFLYGGVIDRPTPLEVGMRADTLIVIDGLADPAAPAVDDIVEADPALWLYLRAQPVFPATAGEPRVETISEGSDVVVALVPVDPTAGPTGYLTLGLTTDGTATYLEIDTADATLAEDAAFWAVTIAGRESFGTAHVGGVMAYRIGDAPVDERIEVTVSVVDTSGEFVIQSTGPLQLLPQR